VGIATIKQTRNSSRMASLMFVLIMAFLLLHTSKSFAACTAEQQHQSDIACQAYTDQKAKCDKAKADGDPNKNQICALAQQYNRTCEMSKQCITTVLPGDLQCAADGNNNTTNKCNDAKYATNDCTRAQRSHDPNVTTICDDASNKRTICTVAKRCDSADTKLKGKIGKHGVDFSGAYCPMVFDSKFETHYGIWNGPFDGTDSDMVDNLCIPCWVYDWWSEECLDDVFDFKHSWYNDAAYCALADFINPGMMCAINNLRPNLDVLDNAPVAAEPTDNYYRDLCIRGSNLKTGDLNAINGLSTSSNATDIYGEKSVGFVAGAKPERGTCMSLQDIPSFTPATSGNAAFAYYKNANNVDFRTNGVDAEGKNGEYKSAYGDSQNLYKSTTFPLGSDVACPADIGGSAMPTDAAGWKKKMAACYDYYVLNRATHPEWTLERAGDRSDDPLTQYDAAQSIFNNCQPLMSGFNSKSLNSGNEALAGFSRVMQYKNRPDLDEMDYSPKKYLEKRWNDKFSGKPLPTFQNLFPCVDNTNADAPAAKRDWETFNIAINAWYGVIALIECRVLPRSCDLTVFPTWIQNDTSYSSPGAVKDGFCPNVERINDPTNPFSPRDMLYKKSSLKTGLPINVPLELPDFSPLSHEYSTDRGYSWETSSIRPIAKERIKGTWATAASGVTSFGGHNVVQEKNYTDYANPENLTDMNKLADMIKHPPVQCAIVPVDILESRREQFDNCIMQRIQYNYHSWRFNNFAEYYGFKNDNWTPPCKTRFYEHDKVQDCPMQFSIQQCCRIIVKDVVPLNYVKIRTCEGLRQKRNLILKDESGKGYDHLTDDSAPSKGGRQYLFNGNDDENKAKYDEVALINQKLSLIGCDGTEPSSVRFDNYFPSDVNLAIVPTDAITKAIGSIRYANNKAIGIARTTADGIFRGAIQLALPALGDAIDLSDTALKTAKAKSVDKVDDELQKFQIEEAQAKTAFRGLRASAKAQIIAIAKAKAADDPAALKVAQDALVSLKAAAISAGEKWAIAAGEEEAAQEVVILGTKGLSMIQENKNSLVSKAQDKLNKAIQKAQDEKDKAITKGQQEANDAAAKLYDKINKKFGKEASDKIDEVVNNLNSSDPPAATLIIAGSHMPYMRWWDTGTSAGNPNHGGSFINTLGSYDVIVGAGREERNYEDAKDPDVKKHLDDEDQPLTQKSQIGRIDGWDGLKGHQMWATRTKNMTCIARTEKLFKPYSAEEFVLAKAGSQYDTKTQNTATDIKPKNGDASGQTYPWPLGWRGYVNSPDADNNFKTNATGLDNAAKGDIIIFDLNGIKQIAFVTEVNQLAVGSNGFVRIESWDQGKFPTAAGVTIASGNVSTRTIYRDAVPPDYRNSLTMTNAAKSGNQPSCEDPNYTACVLPSGGWNSVKIYRPRSDTSRICPYAPDYTIQTSQIDSNIWTKCVNDGYDPPIGLRRIDGYNGAGTGAVQKTNFCGATWGSCSSTAGSTRCFGSGISEDCTAP